MPKTRPSSNSRSRSLHLHAPVEGLGDLRRDPDTGMQGVPARGGTSLRQGGESGRGWPTSTRGFVSVSMLASVSQWAPSMDHFVRLYTLDLNNVSV
jgi:hypothetical protein